MNAHQHAEIEWARIAWHCHQFEHECYGHGCAEDRRLYRIYQRAISGDLSAPLENEAIAPLENEATQTDWLGDLSGRLGADPAAGR